MKCEQPKETIPACYVVESPIVRRVKHALNNGQRELAESILKQYEENDYLDIEFHQHAGWKIRRTCKITGIQTLY